MKSRMMKSKIYWNNSSLSIHDLLYFRNNFSEVILLAGQMLAFKGNIDGF